MGQSKITRSALSIALLERHRGTACVPRKVTVTVNGDGPVDPPPEPDAGAAPEQLFAAGYASCFHDALMLLATRAGIHAGEASVSVTVSLGRDPVDGLFMLSADVRVGLPGVPKPVAEGLVRNVERVCPYTKMARHGIDSVVALAIPPV